MRNTDFRTNKKTNVRSNMDIVRFQGGNPVTLNTWHHVAWVWDRADEKTGTLTGYVDGEKVLSSTPLKGVTKVTLLNNNRGVKIGLKQDTQSSFHGSMDELWIFNDALTAAQVTSLMKTNDIAGAVQVAAATPAPAPPHHHPLPP